MCMVANEGYAQMGDLSEYKGADHEKANIKILSQWLMHFTFLVSEINTLG